MAITDNSFTAAEVQAAVAANPALFSELKNGLTPLGHHAIGKEEYETFVSTEREKIAASKTQEIYTAIDNDVRSASGIDKVNPHEKTYDYLKRAVSSLKTGREDLQTQITTLKEQIAKGDGNQAMKDQLAALQTELKGYKEEKEPQFQKQLFAKDVELQYSLGLRDIAIKKGLPESLVKLAQDNAKAAMVSMAKADANGGIYYVDKDGKTILDGVNPAGATYVLKALLSDIIDTGQQQPGGGSKTPTGPVTNTGVKNADGVEITIPDTIKSQQELHEYLSSQGLTADSKEFNELYKKHGAKLPLRKQAAA
jgi:gas vesicle protein